MKFFFNEVLELEGTEPCSIEWRVSMYRGDYTGAYVPYDDSPADVKARMRSLEALSGGSSYTLPAATTSTLGGVKPDGTTITVDNDGTIHGSSGYTLPTMDSSTKGGAKLGSGLAVSSDTLKVDLSSADTGTLAIARGGTGATTVDNTPFVKKGILSSYGISMEVHGDTDYVVLNANQYNTSNNNVIHQMRFIVSDGVLALQYRMNGGNYSDVYKICDLNQTLDWD